MTHHQWTRVFSLLDTLSQNPHEDAVASLDTSKEDPEVVNEVLRTLKDVETSNTQVSLTGRRFGRYEVGERIGAGSHGEVYRGRDTELGRAVALKFLASTVLLPHDAAHRLVTEAQAASALNHPNIVTVYELLETDVGPVIAMELVDGQSLRSRLSKPIPEHQALHYAVQLLEALSAAHDIGIVHRDIKPENMMLRPDGYLKVLDFGLARQTEPAQSGVIGQTGPAGTLRYMSPEQFRGESLTAASDVFSAGLVLFEMAACNHPFDGGTPLETADLIQRSAGRVKGKDDLQSLALLMLPNAPQERLTAAEALVKLKSHKKARFPITVVLITTGLLFALFLTFYLTRDRPYAPTNEAALTSNLGIEDNPDISPDAKAVVYSYYNDKTAQFQLRIKHLDHDAPFILLQGDRDEGLLYPVWSPDGTSVLYKRTTSVGAALWLINADGSHNRKLKDLVSSVISGMDWHPNGKSIVYSDRSDKNASTRPALHLLNLTVGTDVTLTHPPIDSTADSNPKFSPDGRTLAFERSFAGMRDELFLMPAAGGELRQLTTAQQRLWGFAWTPDSKTLIMSRQVGGHAYALWQITTGKSPELRIFRPAESDNMLAPAARAGRVAWVNGTDANTIFRIPVTGGRLGIVTDSTSLDTAPAVAPDGRIAFVSRRTGSEEVWLTKPDGTDPVRVTNLDQSIRRLAWSPDGRQLLLEAESMGAALVIQCAAKTQSCTKLSRVFPEGLNISWPFWSHDGNSVYFTTPVNGIPQIVRMSDGPIQPLTHGDSSAAGSLSPDGKWLYFVRPGSILRTRLDEKPYREEVVVAHPYRPGYGHYVLTAKELIFWDFKDPAHPSAIRAVNTKTKQVRTVIETENCYMPAVSADGRMLYFAGSDRGRGHIVIVVAELRR